jgi:hypothetical protein
MQEAEAEELKASWGYMARPCLKKQIARLFPAMPMILAILEMKTGRMAVQQHLQQNVSKIPSDTMNLTGIY